jgi:hypothetical protein
MWGALSDKKMGLSFTTVAGLRQCSRSCVRVPRDSWPFYNVTDLLEDFLGNGSLNMFQRALMEAVS